MIASELAAWALSLDEAPPRVFTAAKRHILDGVGNAIAGLRSGAADPAVEVATGLGGPGEATILGTQVKVSAPAAALANGTLIHALDFDDTHAGGLVHATAVVVPAALAVGEEVGATGREVLTAAVVGYEAACRIAAAAPHGFHARGLHATMVAGVFSSALVAARLMGLDAEQTTQALGISGSQAGGLLAFIGTAATTKQLHPGFASQAGIIAARLARAGASGPETVFDGPHGIYDVFTDGEVDRGSILQDLGSRWETARIGIKPYPACQLSHASLDAMTDALSHPGVEADRITSIVAHVHPDSASVVCDPGRDLTRPRSAYDAKFSLPWSVAALTIDGSLTSETFDVESIRRAEVRDLAAKVEVRIVDSGTVAADAPGEVAVTLDDGVTVVGRVRRSSGGPDTPLTDAALQEKFLANTGPAGASALQTLQTIEDHDNIGSILSAAHHAAGE